MRSLFLWSRRAFVAAVGQIGALQIIGGYPVAKAAGTSEVELLRAACAELSCPPSMADACRRALGLTGLSMGPISLGLVRDLRSAGYDCNTVPAILDALRDQSRRDFGAAKIVSVDGWILSRTETRAYAIASVTAII